VPAPPRRPRPGSAKPKRDVGSGNRNPGLGNVDEILKRQAEKRAAGRTQWVKVSDDDDEPTVVRAWDVKSSKGGNKGMFRQGYIHQVEFTIEVEDRQRRGKRKKIKIRRDRWCLDQLEQGEPCPGCADELERRFKFWLPVIERQAPITTDAGKVTGYKDRCAILSGGARLVAALQRIQKKKGLINQDVEITKSGEGFGVQYAADALPRAPLSDEDKKLIKDFEAEKKLDRYTEIYDFDHFYDPPGQHDDDDDDDEDVGAKSQRRGSSFGPRNAKRPARSSQRDDDDDDDDDGPPRRQRRSGRAQAGKRKPGGPLAGLGKRTSSNDEEQQPRRSTRRRRPR
jgi:hypothetical protein